MSFGVRSFGVCTLVDVLAICTAHFCTSQNSAIHSHCFEILAQNKHFMFQLSRAKN